MGTLGTLSSIPGQTMGIGVFTDYLIEVLGLTRTQLAFTYMCGTVASGFILPYGGRWVDRAGARIMTVAACVGLAASLCLLATSGSIAHALDPVLGAGLRTAFAMVVITGCFLCVRFFGQGLMAMIPRIMIGKWFQRRRGLAAGVSGVFVTCGFSLTPLLINALIQRFTWQGACLVLALVIGAGMAAVAALFFRDNPEECGLHPDGADPQQKHHTSLDGGAIIRHFTLREAQASYAFWIFTLALAAQGLIVTAVTFHLVALGQEMGIGRDMMFQVFVPMPIFSVTANLVGGYLSDRIQLNRLLFVMMPMLAVGTIALLFLDHAWGWWGMIVGFGISGGLFGTLVTVTWPRFFGLQHLGAISGFNMSVMVVASAIGPILFAVSEAYTGSFQAAILGCCLIPAVVFVAGIKARNPQQAGP